MPGPVHTIDAWVLDKRPPSDAFQTLTVYSVAFGATLALQRLSKKSTPVASLDLFDEASLLMEEPDAGRASFIKEARLLHRPGEIGRSYDSLRFASKLAQLVSRNPTDEESRERVYRLLGEAFTAFKQSPRPDVVYLKSLYRFCRDEGYPLKQAWLPNLATSDRESATRVLNEPASEQTTEPKVVARLQRRLDDFLRAETEILLD